MTHYVPQLLLALTIAAFVPRTTTPDADLQDPYNVSTGTTLVGAPLGVHGFDPYLLGTVGAAAHGDAAFTVVHDDVAYYFASQTSADRFAADPNAFLPQFGAFCAYAVALGKKLDGDPRFADVVDGKLYLFVNAQIFAKYLANKEQVLADAHRKWPTIRGKAVGDL